MIVISQQQLFYFSQSELLFWGWKVLTYNVPSSHLVYSPQCLK